MKFLIKYFLIGAEAMQPSERIVTTEVTQRDAFEHLLTLASCGNPNAQLLVIGVGKSESKALFSLRPNRGKLPGSFKNFSFVGESILSTRIGIRHLPRFL